MPLTTLIVDDTITYRKILSEVAATFSELQVIGTANNGQFALKKMEQSPIDLVLLDIHMPGLDGVETLKLIRLRFPDTLVIMISGVTTRSAASTIQALELGAVDFIRKPEGGSPQENLQHLINDLRPILKLIGIKIATRGVLHRVGAAAPVPRQPLPSQVVKPVRPAICPRSFGVVAIGVSTGGPEALGKVIPLIRGNFPVPIVLVQHMPPLFTKSLAESLARKSKIAVVEGEDGQQLVNGTAYVAPGGKHMVVRRNESGVFVGLNDEPPVNSCRPSVDVLFRAVANVYGDRGVLAIILTGMGSDGLNGVRVLKRTSSCFCITQAEQTCVVYGMPRAIDEAGLTDKSLPIDKIAQEINQLVV